MTKQISIVIPVWNESKNIEPLVTRTAVAMNKARIKYELIFLSMTNPRIIQ